MNLYEVTSTRPDGPSRFLYLKGHSARKVRVTVPRFSCVGKGDTIALDSSMISRVSVQSSERADDLISVLPHFETYNSFSFANKSIPIRITEVTNQKDLDAASFLERFHYRTNNLTDASSTGGAFSTVGGRKALLIMYLKLAESWQAVGYVDIQMPLLMCKPRHRLLSSGFKHTKRPIEWEDWNQRAIAKYTNTIARIARVVISPEFRGLGLTRQLLSTAKHYCTARWHVGGVRPLFVEISAEMLNYIDFVSSSGFRLIGVTEGNINRLVADLASMNRGYTVKGGILSLQKKYLETVRQYMRHTDSTFEEVQTRLQQILSSDDPVGSLSPREWTYFRSVIRTPIPYFLAPLDVDAEAFLEKNAPNPSRKKRSPFSVKSPKINLTSVTATAQVSIKQTPNIRIIMESFGLKGEVMRSTLVEPISIVASAGNIILIAGTSGSGKSVLLQALDPLRRSEGISGNIEFEVTGTQSYSAGWLNALPKDRALFEHLASTYGPERAFAAVSETGLSEAMTLIKPFWMLSRGQQYRAMLADLLLRDQQVWLLDEFGADLDPLTAKVIANNLRRQTMRTNRITFVATANHGHFIRALKPTSILLLRAGQEALRLRQWEYRDEFLDEAI